MLGSAAIPSTNVLAVNVSVSTHVDPFVDICSVTVPTQVPVIDTWKGPYMRTESENVFCAVMLDCTDKCDVPKIIAAPMLPAPKHR